MVSWKSAVKVGQYFSQEYPDQFLTVRYEDLVLNPGWETRKICDFLGLKFDDYLMNVTVGNPAEMEKKHEEGISASSIGRYKKLLTSEEVAMCQRVDKEEMAYFGYEFMSVTWLDRFKTSFIIMRSLLVLPRRLWKKWRTGGTEQFQNILLDYSRRFIRLFR